MATADLSGLQHWVLQICLCSAKKATLRCRHNWLYNFQGQVQSKNVNPLFKSNNFRIGTAPNKNKALSDSTICMDVALNVEICVEKTSEPKRTPGTRKENPCLGSVFPVLSMNIV